ncbi:MAG TPA: Yip1 family protein [Hanamia sp.]|nr:Yip1 family protein [Hanamia sp.]
MNLIERAKNMLVTPKAEWLLIETEIATPKSLLISYVLPMAIIASIGKILTGLVWAGLFTSYFIWAAIFAFISIIVSFYISIYIIDMLAPSFGSERNLNKSAQLVAYSNTPNWIAGLLSFIPIIGWLLVIAGWIYSIYLFYIGLGPLKKTPEDKKVVYMIVAFIIMIAVVFIISAILMAIFGGLIGYGLGYGHFGRFGM